MQTFLPSPDLAKGAAVLDRARLGKQRVEVLQIANALFVPGYGWAQHPAVAMWRGCERALLEYGLFICDEWLARGYHDSVAGKLHALGEAHGIDMADEDFETPWWLGEPDFHRSHRSNLLRKDRAFYERRFERGLPDDLPYLWPQEEPGLFVEGERPLAAS